MAGKAKAPRKREPAPRGPGRPSLGARAHTRIVPIKVSEDEYAAVVKAVEQRNAELPTGAKQETVSSWFREYALAPLGFGSARRR